MKPIFEKINKQEDQSFYLEVVERPYFIDLWHFHPEIEILYIKKGYGTRYIGDSIGSFCDDDLVIIGQDTPHVWSSHNDFLDPENNKLSSAVCIQFPEDFIVHPLRVIPEFFHIREFLNSAKRGIQFTGNTHFELASRVTSLPSLKGMDRLIGLLNILNIMSTSRELRFLSSPGYKPAVNNTADKHKMETIYRYVIRNFPGKIELEEISALVNLTPQSFCRYFKSRTTKVFSAFVNEVRIGNACKMLIEDKYSIASVCYMSGFNHLSNFNRQFRKLKGMTPSEFQKKFSNHSFEMMLEQ
jgi:AraC-like DNA-binding protein